MRRIDMMRAVRAKALLQRVDGAGADVTEDDPERRDDEGGGGEFMESVIFLFFHDAGMSREAATVASEGQKARR